MAKREVWLAQGANGYGPLVITQVGCLEEGTEAVCVMPAEEFIFPPSPEGYSIVPTAIYREERLEIKTDGEWIKLNFGETLAIECNTPFHIRAFMDDVVFFIRPMPPNIPAPLGKTTNHLLQ